MGKPKLLEVSETLNVLPFTKASVTGATIGLGKNKLKLKTTSGGRHTVELVHGNLTASVSGPLKGKKDLSVEWKKNVRKGDKPVDLKLTQRVPAQNFHLIPTPEIKLTATSLKTKKLRDELTLTHDMLTRTSKIEEVVELNGKYKLKLAADSRTKVGGSVASLTAKLNKSWGKSVGASFCPMRGPVATYDLQTPAVSSKPRALLETSTNLRTREVVLSGELRATKESKHKLTVEARAALPGGKARPSVLFGYKYAK